MQLCMNSIILRTQLQSAFSIQLNSNTATAHKLKFTFHWYTIQFSTKRISTSGCSCCTVVQLALKLKTCTNAQLITARKRSLGQGNIFTGVCLATGWGGVYPSLQWDTPCRQTLPRRDDH